MSKLLISLSLLLFTVLTVSGQKTILTTGEAKSIINVLNNVAENSPEGRKYAILKLDSLIEESQKENALLFLDAKNKINELKPIFRKSKSLSVLNKEDLKGFTVTRDKFTNNTFILPVYGLWGGQFRAYIINTEGLVALRFVVEYRSSNWLFFNKVIMMTGDQKIEYNDLNTSRNIYDGIEEKSDVVVNENLLKFLEAAVKNQEVQVRLEGDERLRDTEMSKKQIKSIANAIKIYKKLLDE